jgi:hypothetical protein
MRLATACWEDGGASCQFVIGRQWFSHSLFAGGPKLQPASIPGHHFFLVLLNEHGAADSKELVFIRLTGALVIYAHVFGILVLAAHWGSLVFLRRREVPWKGLLASTAAVGLLASPVGILLFARASEPNAPLAWAHRPTLYNIYELFCSLTGNADFRDAPGCKPIVAAYLVICLVTILSGAHIWRSSGRSFEAWRPGFLLSCLFLPILLTFSISTVRPVFVNKCLLVSTTFNATGSEEDSVDKAQMARGGALLTTVSLPASVLTSYYQFRSRNHEWKTLTDYVLVQARPGDAVIFYVAPGRLCFDYYRAKYRGSSKGLDVVYPEFGDEKRDPSALLYMPPMRSDLTDYVATRYRRVWVVLYHDEFAFTSGLSRRIQDFTFCKVPQYTGEYSRRAKRTSEAAAICQRQ